MKNILIVSLTALLLVACASTTQPPPDPTATPIPPMPTNTPIPTPIPPTPTPTVIPIDDFIEQMDAVTIYRLMDAERRFYSIGFYRFAIGIATELIDTWLGDYPTMYKLRAESYWKLGDFENAIKDMKKAAELPPIDPDPTGASTLNTLCWYLAIAGKPEEALPYCEEAVSIDPDPMYLDSRGLVYALLGRTDDAITDFGKVIEDLEDNTDSSIVEVRESREKWSADLMAGIEFTEPEFLEELQAGEIDPNAFPEPDRLQAEDYTRTHFSQILENDGFANLGILEDDNGIEMEQYVIEFNGCINMIRVIGPEDETAGVLMHLLNCTEDQVFAEMLWFLQLLYYPNPNTDNDSIEMGQGFAWIMKDVLAVYEGKIDETEVKPIYGIQFFADDIEIPDLGSGLMVMSILP